MSSATDHPLTMTQLAPGLQPTPPIRGLAFHHIGIACRDFEAETQAFGMLGYTAESPDFYDPLQGIDGRFLIGGGPRLELLRNHQEPGVLTPWLRKGIRFYHLAFEADDFALRRGELADLGAKEVVAPQPAVAFGGRLICFTMLKNHTLIELISTT
jgi:methylmalonyl-CoA/ethylmalonyl-CoA epimerase